MSKFNKKYTNIDVILIDDIQFIESKEKSMERMQHTFDKLYEKGKQIVITSDRIPEEIPKLISIFMLLLSLSDKFFLFLILIWLK